MNQHTHPNQIALDRVRILRNKAAYWKKKPCAEFSITILTRYTLFLKSGPRSQYTAKKIPSNLKIVFSTKYSVYNVVIQSLLPKNPLLPLYVCNHSESVSLSCANSLGPFWTCRPNGQKILSGKNIWDRGI